MDEIDKRIKYIWNRFKKKDTGSKSDNCPQEKTLSRYIAGVLKKADREMVEKHLLECNRCLDLILLHKKIKEDEAYEGIIDVPKPWIERAIALNTQKKKDKSKGFFDIVLRFTQETIEIIRNPGNLSVSYGTIPVQLRAEKGVSSNIVHLRKRFSHIESEVQVERAGDGIVNMKVTTKDVENGLFVKGLRISLLNPRREIASYIVQNGEAFFKGIRFGEYVIKLIRQGREIGQISLNIGNEKNA